MRLNRGLHRLSLLCLLLASVLLAPGSRADTPPPLEETPVAKVYFMGAEYQLYTTTTPNYYRDQFRNLWVPILGDPEPGHAKYLYKKIEFATADELEKLKKLDPSTMPGVFYDHRGEQWIQSKDPETKKTIYIRLANATEGDMKSLGPNEAANLVWMWLHQAKEFPNQAIKFSVAQFMVEMTACFGLNVLTFTNASADNPACSTEFFQHLLDPKGLAGFYMFMVASGYSTEITMRIIETAVSLQGKQVSNAVLRAKFMPYLGYFGMVAGSLASSLTEQILSNKNWTPCLSSLQDEGLLNEYCVKVFTSFATDDQFWQSFFGSVPSLVLSSVAAHFTQQIIVSNYMRLTTSAEFEKLGVKVLQFGKWTIMRNALKLGRWAGLSVRFVGGFLGGVPGVIVFVASEYGQFVGFLKYQEWFEFPLMRAINDRVLTNKTNDGIAKILAGVEGNQKNGWSTAVTNDFNCHWDYSNGPRKLVCDTEELIPAGAATLKTEAENFRKRVLINQFDEANNKWGIKMMGFTNKYRASKMLLEHLYAQRKEFPVSTQMSLPSVATQLMQLWMMGLEIEGPPEPEKQKYVVEVMAEVLLILADLKDLEPANGPLSDKPSYFESSILPLFPEIQQAVLLAQKTKEEKLLEDMLAFKDKSGPYLSNMMSFGLGAGNSALGYPRLHAAVAAMQAIDFNKLPMTDSSDEAQKLKDTGEFMHMLAGMYGNDLLLEMFGELLCNINQTEFTADHTGTDGFAASLNLPMMLKVSEKNISSYEFNNCLDANNQRKYKLDLSDLERPWLVGDRVFANPVALLLDKDSPLNLGGTLEDAQKNWQKRAFPIAADFMKDMTLRYNEMVKNDFLPQVPQMTAAELVQRSSPRMRGPELDYHIVTVGQWKFNVPYLEYLLPISLGDRPLLSESLLGQIQFLMEQIKYKGPDFPAKTVDGVRLPGKYELCDLIIAKFAEHIVTLHHEVDPAAVSAAWKDYTNEIQYIGSSQDQLDQANRDFAARIYEINFSKEKAELIRNQRAAIDPLLDQLYQGLTGFDRTELDGMTVEAYMYGMPPEEARKLSPQEYKKYIFYQLQYDSMSNILLEIKKIYDKLGLQVFTSMPEETH